MDLHTAYPFSLLKNGLLHPYNSLQQDRQADVAILGAGITGALAAYELSKAGLHCIVVDKRHVGTGSTAASTSLIQYEIDEPLHRLIKKRGYDHAVRSYHRSLQAVDELESLCWELGPANRFESRISLQYASRSRDTKALQEEVQLRKKEGFSVSYLEEEELNAQFGIKKSGALLNERAGQMDAYCFTHQLLQAVVQRGSEVYDHTPVTEVETTAEGVRLQSAAGHTVRARHLVIACGYESGRYLSKSVEQLYTTYALVTEPLPREEVWHRNALIWETATPYLYLRTTEDRRVLIGGLDTEYSPRDPFRQLDKKTDRLHSELTALFPNITAPVDFNWAGVFANTADGLPYIGSVPERPRTYFALGYGGNGITFSSIASRLITDAILGKSNPDAELFAFNR